MRRIALPFLTLPDDAINFHGWMIGDPGAPLANASDILDNWDYERDLEVSAEIEVEFSKAAQSLDLPEDELKLAVGLARGTGAGSIPRNVNRLGSTVLDQGRQSAILSSVLPGSGLSARIMLELQITLEAPLGSGGVLAPKERGSRLWRTRRDILIEDGGDSRFPIELLSFSENFAGRPEQFAPWFLHWKPGNLETDFGGGVRLYVNSDFETVAERFVNGDRATLQSILGDVISQMVSVVLDQEDCEETLQTCAEGSIGGQVRAWIDLAFPGQSFGAIRSMRDHIPGRFRAALLAAADPGGDE